MKDRRISRRAVIRAGLGLAGSLPLNGLLSGCGTPRSQSGPIQLRLSSSLPPGENSSHWVWYDKFSQLLAEKTNQRVQIQPFPSNELGEESEVVQQVQHSTIDMMISGSSIWAYAVPEIAMLDLGYIFVNLDSIGQALDGPAGTSLATMMADKANILVLGWAYSLGARNLCTKEPITSMSDLSGKRIRVIKNASFYATLEMMGATPVPLAINKITAELQAGTIDGLEQDAPTILANKWADIAQHVTLTQHIFSPVMPVISRLAFEKIPQELREPFLEAAKEATSFQRQQAHTTEQRAIEQLRSNGVIIQSIDREPFERSVKPLWNIFTTIHPATKEILTQLHTSLALER